MPPAISTRPSGSNVAECPERGASISAPPISRPVPARDVLAGAENAMATTQTPATTPITRRDERVIGPPQRPSAPGRELYLCCTGRGGLPSVSTGCSFQRLLRLVVRL